MAQRVLDEILRMLATIPRHAFLAVAPALLLGGLTGCTSAVEDQAISWSDARAAGVCTVMPSPALIESDYVASYGRLKPDRVLSVVISDAGGARTFSVRADATGVARVTSRSSVAGPGSVSFYAQGHLRTALAFCTFEVQAGSADAGSSGTGSIDAGSGDAGAGSGDAGAGSGDAGSSDANAGSSDSGSSDAGSGDASTGSSDAGSTDASSNDAGSTGTGSGGAGGSIGTRTDWPCTGCITIVPPNYAPATPVRLLLVMHGDEGSPGVIVSFWQQAALDAGYILFAPECPRSLGCTGSWWRWNQNMSWVFAQIDTIEAAYNVDLAGVYATGGSGGAVYLGYRSDELAPRIAGVNFTSGGFSALSGLCPTCRLPAYILIGDQDFLLSNAELTRDYYLGCNSEVLYDLLPGVDHQGGAEAIRAGKGAAILQWFNARPNRCFP